MKSNSFLSAWARLAEPWSIIPSQHATMLVVLERFQAEQWHKTNAGAFPSDSLVQGLSYTVQDGGVALLDISGALTLRPSDAERMFLDVADSEEIGSVLLQIATDPRVASVVLNINSPGGTVTGTPELAAAVNRLNASKPVVAFTDSLMASAAYWVASQASLIVASISASVGGIGVYSTLLDLSRAYAAAGVERKVFTNDGGTLKTIGLPGTSLTPEQEAHMQERVNEHMAVFKRAVLDRRPQVSPAAMKGQVLFGESAVRAGLVDHIGNLGDAVASATQLRRLFA